VRWVELVMDPHAAHRGSGSRRRSLKPADHYPVALPVDDIPVALPAEDDALAIAEAYQAYPEVLPVATPDPRRARRFVHSAWWGLVSLGEWCFGAVSLIVGLAVLAALPIIQFLPLGYLLEAGGRVARTGRLREGFIGVRVAARLGSLVLGTWLMLLPLRLVSSLWASAQLIDPDGPTARGWKFTLTLLTALIAIHVVAACSRGGKLRYFFWPFNGVWLARRLWRGGYYTEARDAVWDFVMGLRLPYYFWLGLRGFAGAFLWLVVPITLLATGRKVPPVGFGGGLLLAIVLLYVPFLQIRFASENRFRAFFELRAIRDHFRRAPWAFGFALVITLLFAVPLYLLKIEIIPREAAWLPGVLFLIFIFPARLLTGWAYSRAERRTTPRHWFFRWTSRLGMLPVVLAYVAIVFFSQYAAWGGIWSLYEQHAFLLPVPFLGM
jgi:hypothetical protein